MEEKQHEDVSEETLAEEAKGEEVVQRPDQGAAEGAAELSTGDAQAERIGGEGVAQVTNFDTEAVAAQAVAEGEPVGDGADTTDEGGDERPLHEMDAFEVLKKLAAGEITREQAREWIDAKSADI